MSTELATKSALQYAASVADNLRSLKSDSLIEYTQPTRVEPIVLMDDRVSHLEMTHDLMQSLASIFAGYYLQAVALSVNVGKIDVIRLLDKVNPNRSVADNALRWGMSLEAYKYGLPVPGEPVGLEHFGLDEPVVSNEGLYSDKRVEELRRAAKKDLEEGIRQAKQEAEKSLSQITDVGDDERNKILQKLNDAVNERKVRTADQLIDAVRKFETSVSFGDNALKTATEASNLSVGKMIEVTLEDGDRQATFPISLRLMVTVAPASGVKQVLTVNNKAVSAKERYHQWRAGQLSMIRDIVMCQDLITDHKNGLIKDKTGIYEQSRKRRRNNSLSAIFSGNPSIATASNIIVISEETAKDVEREIGGRLKDMRTREKVFKETYTMLLAVIDPRWETVTIYHRSIDSPTELSARDIKNPSTKGGPDITEILKAYTMGNSPL